MFTFCSSFAHVLKHFKASVRNPGLNSDRGARQSAGMEFRRREKKRKRRERGDSDSGGKRRRQLHRPLYIFGEGEGKKLGMGQCMKRGPEVRDSTMTISFCFVLNVRNPRPFGTSLLLLFDDGESRTMTISPSSSPFARSSYQRIPGSVVAGGAVTSGAKAKFLLLFFSRCLRWANCRCLEIREKISAVDVIKFLC